MTYTVSDRMLNPIHSLGNLLNYWYHNLKLTYMYAVPYPVFTKSCNL